MLTVNSSRNFTLEQLKSFRTQLAFLYQSHATGLKDAFENHCQYQTQYRLDIENIKNRLREKSILEL
jgi:hypothetical protein